MTQSTAKRHYRGITHTKWGWQAQIKVNGRMMYLGLFTVSKLAAKAYDKAAKKYHGIKAKLNNYDSDFTYRLITIRQEQIYRLCSPDFYNLKQKYAAILLGISEATICNELKRTKKKCPSLFPLYHRPSDLPMYVALGRCLYYQPWMDDKIIMRF